MGRTSVSNAGNISSVSDGSFIRRHKLTFFLLLSFVAMAFIDGVTNFILFPTLVLFGLIDYKKNSPFTILLLSMMLFLNPVFGSLPSILWNVSLIIFTALFIIKNKFHINRLEATFFSTIILFILTSLLVSPLPSIAVVKGISLIIFSYVMFKVYKWGYIDEVKLRQIVEAIIIANFALYFIPSGYYINGLFMGVFNHSQSIGLFLVPLLTYYALSFFEKETHSKWEGIYAMSIILLGSLELLATYSRTTIFTYTVLMLLYFVFNNSKVKRILFTVNKPVILIATIFTLGYMATNIPTIVSASQNYIYKSYINEVSQSVGNKNILGSRAVLFTESFENFKKHPILGNGFGIQYRNGRLADNELKYLPLFDVPYTMVNEKGNVYLAVLEEGGLIAFVLFIFFVVLQLKKTIKYRTVFYPSLAIFIMFNGEATFFSLNGAGAFQFVFLIMLYFLAQQKLKTVPGGMIISGV